MKPDFPEVIADSVGDVPLIELRELAEVLAELGVVGREEPAATARERLLAAITRSPDRWAPFAHRLARMFDLSVAKMTTVLARLDDPSAWEPGPIPGVSLLHFDGGQSLATADSGFVRLAPGTEFPDHRHVGIERVLIVEGAYVASDGRTYRAGDEHPMEAGTTHSYVVTADGPCTFAVTLSAGIEIGGTVVRGRAARR